MINLGDFVQRLSAIGAQATFDLRKPLREAVGEAIQSRFSPSAREIAASFVWPKIQPQFDSALVGYDDLSRDLSRFDAVREAAKGGVVDLAQARANATNYGWMSIIVSVCTMTCAALVRLGGGTEEQSGGAFLLALVASLIAFVPHVVTSATLKRGSRQLASARRFGPDDEQALSQLESLWETKKNDFQSLASALDRAVSETSTIRSVRKATLYDEMVEAEVEALRQAERANISYTNMLAAQARIAGAMTPEERRAADSKYRSDAMDWRVRQQWVAEAEAKLRLAKIAYEGL